MTSATDGPLELVWEERLVGGQPDYTWYDPIATVNLELKAGKVETVEMRQVIQQCSPRYDQREGTSVFVMTANGEPLEFEGQTLLFGDSEDCSLPPG